MRAPRLHPFGVVGLLLAANALGAFANGAPAGWETAAPRDEIRPEFRYEPRGGPDRKGSFIIESDRREGLMGRWMKTFPVKGGEFYKFSALRKVSNMSEPRRGAVIRILWQDDNGKAVNHDEPSYASYSPGSTPRAEPEYPSDHATNARGWTEVSDVYHAPSKATRAVVEMEFRWAPRAKVEWAEVALNETAAPAPRKVRMAAVHFVPRNTKTPEERRQAFVPQIEEAAKQKADIVVLPEVLTYGSGSTYASVAEPMPGPSTEFFGALAKKHNL
ncbi:MAG TPA: nitrilase-related carbon-nitrogen hydrolase, partial [Verrucomicrobiae bacterium]